MLDISPTNPNPSNLIEGQWPHGGARLDLSQLESSCPFLPLRNYEKPVGFVGFVNIYDRQREANARLAPRGFGG